MKHWTHIQRDKINQLNQYVDELENRETKLLEAVSQLSQGFGTPNAWNANESHTTKMQRLAGNTMVEVSKMRIIKRVRP